MFPLALALQIISAASLESLVVGAAYCVCNLVVPRDETDYLKRTSARLETAKFGLLW